MAYVPGAALLAALVVGCSAGTGTDGSAADSRPGGPTASPAAPAGKYRTLPDPCRSVAHSTLKDLLPGVAELPEDQQEKAYAGTASVTYDTDRRVGCTWKAEAPDSSRSLSLDFERVVSYDTSVSDDDRADEVYGKKEAAAHLPSSPSDSPSGSRRTPRRARHRATRRPTVRPTERAATGQPEPPKTFNRASSTTSEMPHFWTICSSRQVPPHSTAR